MEIRSARDIWDTALGELEVQVSKANFRTWLANTKGLYVSEEHFTVGVPNAFIAEYLDKNQRSLIEKTLINIIRHSLEVEFRVLGSEEPSGDSGQRSSVLPAVNLTLNPKYTFNSFVVTNCNHLAYAAAMGVAENPGHTFNPLFIFGGAGLGKTHLLHAIGQMAHAQCSNIVYLSAEQFTNDFINAVRNRDTESFRSKYRNVDMLLVDDIQFISGKEQTEESFFHTFNELHNCNKQIAISCDCPPKDIPQMANRLRSRLAWGLAAGIEPPDFDTRVKILDDKARRQGIVLNSDVLQIIAGQSTDNVREIEGYLNRVVAYSQLLRAPITPELASKAVAGINSKQEPDEEDSAEAIIQMVSDDLRVDIEDMKSRKRDRKSSHARQIAMYLLRQKTEFSLAQIGKFMGNREPISVSQACKKVAKMLTGDPLLKKQVDEFQSKLPLK